MYGAHISHSSVQLILQFGGVTGLIVITGLLADHVSHPPQLCLC